MRLVDWIIVLSAVLSFALVALLLLMVVDLVGRRQVIRRVSQGVSVGSAQTQGPIGLRQEAVRLQALIDALSRLSLPQGAGSGSGLRLRLLRAGIRGDDAPRIYYAAKSLLTLVVPLSASAVLLHLFAGTSVVQAGMVAVLLAAGGYYLPDLYLRWRTERRVEEMRAVLPDLIDLLLVCVESGLGLDAAMNRVAREIARNSSALSEELYLAGLEVRAGGGRIDALRHMAERIGIEDLDNLVAMLVQADRFGTSLGEALRTQSEVMRVKRMQRAEEMAAKIPVKILFPLVCCVFPALLTVLLGPAVIQLIGVLGGH